MTLENKTQAETQKILVSKLPAYEEKLTQKNKPITYHNDESVTVTLKLSKEQFELLQKVKELMSHIENGKTEDVMMNLCQKELNKRLGKKLDNSKSSKAALIAETESIAATGFAVQKRDSVLTDQLPSRKAISAQVKKVVFQKYNNCCAQCESKFQLQVDHIKPVWAGGDSHPDNLQLLCAVHNKRKYKLQCGLA